MSWNNIKGQEFAVRLFRAHLKGGCVPNAYLLAGPDGVGKRRLALEMAKALNCAAEGERPCEACAPCRQIERGTHPDVHVVEGAGAAQQIRLDDVRHVLGRLALRPYSARMQVALLDGADRITEEAANALLKVLEEPPATSRFLLTTSRLACCLPTIISRCQVIRCRALSPEVIEALAGQDLPGDPAAARTIARRCGGSLSRARALAQRWPLLQETVRRLAVADTRSWQEAPAPDTRQDVGDWLDDLIVWLRDVAIARYAPVEALVHAAEAPAVRAQAHRTDPARCADAALSLLPLRESLEQFVSPRLIASLARERWLSLHAG